MSFTMYGVLCLTVFSDFNCCEFCACEACFHAELIGASLVMIACNSGKLFVFFSTRLLNVNVL